MTGNNVSRAGSGSDLGQKARAARLVIPLAMALCFDARTPVADPSLECSVTASSQVETGECLARVEENAKAALDIIYRTAREAAAELDQITGRDVALPALETAQTAWQGFRDAQCDYRGALFGGGSGTGIEIRACRIEMTRTRIRELRASLR